MKRMVSIELYIKKNWKKSRGEDKKYTTNRIEYKKWSYSN